MCVCVCVVLVTFALFDQHVTSACGDSSTLNHFCTVLSLNYVSPLLLASDRVYVYDKMIQDIGSKMRRTFSVTHVLMCFTLKNIVYKDKALQHYIQ